MTLPSFYQLSERRMRISVDIDNGKNNLKPLQAYFTLKHLFRNCIISQDRTRHGFHVKAVGEEIARIPIEKRVFIRETLCDDERRIRIDKIKLEMGLPQFVETLFVWKRSRDGIVGRAEPMDPVALPWISRLPSKKVSAEHISGEPQRP